MAQRQRNTRSPRLDQQPSYLVTSVCLLKSLPEDVGYPTLASEQLDRQLNRWLKEVGIPVNCVKGVQYYYDKKHGPVENLFSAIAAVIVTWCCHDEVAASVNADNNLHLYAQQTTAMGRAMIHYVGPQADSQSAAESEAPSEADAQEEEKMVLKPGLCYSWVVKKSCVFASVGCYYLHEVPEDRQKEAAFIRAKYAKMCRFRGNCRSMRDGTGCLYQHVGEYKTQPLQQLPEPQQQPLPKKHHDDKTGEILTGEEYRQKQQQMKSRAKR